MKTCMKQEAAAKAPSCFYLHFQNYLAEGTIFYENSVIFVAN